MIEADVELDVAQVVAGEVATGAVATDRCLETRSGLVELKGHSLNS